MLKDWSWQTKDAPVVSLINTLLKIDDDFAPDRIGEALTGPNGFLSILMNNRHQQQQHHQQYDVYSSQSLVQRYQELLKGLCAIPLVQDFVHKRAMTASDTGGVLSVEDEQYMWLDDQIHQLLLRGHLNSSFLIQDLKRTIVQVSGAGEDAVNGNYRFSRLLEHNTALYKKDTFFRNTTVTFQIYRCRMDNHVHQWFISIVPAGKDPGTNADEDFYCKPSLWKPAPTHHNQQYQSLQQASFSLYGDSDVDVKPPEGVWSMVNTNKSCKVKPAPTIRWLVRDEEDDDENEDDRGEEARGRGVYARGGGQESDSESDKEDSMAVVDDEDRFAAEDDEDEDEYIGRGDADMIDDDDI